MSLISWRRVQGGGYGDGHLDLVILLAENDISVSLTSTLPFTFTLSAEYGDSKKGNEHCWLSDH